MMGLAIMMRGVCLGGGTVCIYVIVIIEMGLGLVVIEIGMECALF